MSNVVAATRLVVGTKDDDGGYAVFVRVGSGTLKVDLIPGSAKPSVGDGLFVISSDAGNFGIAIPVDTDLAPFPVAIEINYNLSLPDGTQLLPDSIGVVPCTITAWDLEADAAGSVSLDILQGGVSIVGATPPTLSAAATASGVPGIDWSPILTEGRLAFVVSGVDTIQRLNIWLKADRTLAP